MTFNPNADVSNSSARRRGGGGVAKVGGGVGIAGLAVLLIYMFTGNDLSGLLPMLDGGSQQGSGTSVESSVGGRAILSAGFIGRVGRRSWTSLGRRGLPI